MILQIRRRPEPFELDHKGPVERQNFQIKKGRIIISRLKTIKQRQIIDLIYLFKETE